MDILAILALFWPDNDTGIGLVWRHRPQVFGRNGVLSTAKMEPLLVVYDIVTYVRDVLASELANAADTRNTTFDVDAWVVNLPVLLRRL